MSVDDKKSLSAITRSTRSGGTYTLVWDGLDDKGKAVPTGNYTVRIDVHREHGRHYKDMYGVIECGEGTASGKIRGNVEIPEVKISYGPAGR